VKRSPIWAALCLVVAQIVGTAFAVLIAISLVPPP
jgi:hypothetical protein